MIPSMYLLTACCVHSPRLGLEEAGGSLGPPPRLGKPWPDVLNCSNRGHEAVSGLREARGPEGPGAFMGH